MILGWIFIGIILNYLGLLKGWTLFWFIVCCALDILIIDKRNKNE